MKMIFRCGIDSHSGFSKSAIVEASKRWPKFVEYPGSVLIEVVYLSPEFHELEQFLLAHGMPISYEDYPPPDTTPIGGQRIFDATDLDEAEFFCMWIDKRIARESKFDEDGQEFFKSQHVNKTLLGSSPLIPLQYYMRDSFRKLLTEQGFKGLDLQEAKVIGKDGECRLWRIDSTLEMPPMLNSFVTEHLQPCAATFGPPKLPATRYDVTDRFFPPVYRFRRAESSQLANADFVKTREHFGFNFIIPNILVSQRVRKFFDAQKFPIDWCPVTLE